MKIYEVPSERRYWVVRAEGGLYYDHFTRNGLMALGHLNSLGIAQEDSDKFIPDEGWLKNTIAKKSQDLNSSRRQESVSFNQIKNFIYDIQDGDWVITVGYNSLRVGIVEGDAFIKNESIVVYYDIEKDRKVEMEANLRRKVIWGPTISRASMPFGLLSSLRANQTVFNLDKHWEAIYHSLYPAFSKGDDLYLSLKIRQENDISNYSVVQILSFLNEIEVVAKELNEQLDDNDFDQIFSQYVSQGLLTLTTKAQFNSPGDIWNKLDFSGLKKTKMGYVLVGYAMLFGNEHAGMDGLIDLESRQKLWAIVADRIEQKDMEKVVSNLELSKPQHDTTILESKDKNKITKLSN
jgi:predicted Mrr-cat superfamily restriction endonuclease